MIVAIKRKVGQFIVLIAEFQSKTFSPSTLIEFIMNRTKSGGRQLLILLSAGYAAGHTLISFPIISGS